MIGVFFMPKGIWKKHYSGEFKQMVIDDMRKNHLGSREAERKYEIGFLLLEVKLWKNWNCFKRQ